MVMFQQFGLENRPIFKHFELTNMNYPLHLHKAFELIIVSKGRLTVRIDDNQYTVNPRQIIIIFPDQVHGFNMIPQTKITIILFSPELIPTFMEQNHGKILLNPVFYFPKTINFNNITNQFAIKALLYSICNLMVTHGSFSEKHTSKRNDIIHSLINYVNENYSTNCSLSNASKKTGYDYAYLSRLFKSVMEMSFTKYLNHYRISKAEQLLSDTSMTITAISFNVGYSNLRTFNRNFQKIVRTSPSEYRKKNDKNFYSKAFQENYISG